MPLKKNKNEKIRKNLDDTLSIFVFDEVHVLDSYKREESIVVNYNEDFSYTIVSFVEQLFKSGISYARPPTGRYNLIALSVHA